MELAKTDLKCAARLDTEWSRVQKIDARRNVPVVRVVQRAPHLAMQRTPAIARHSPREVFAAESAMAPSALKISRSDILIDKGRQTAAPSKGCQFNIVVLLISRPYTQREITMACPLQSPVRNAAPVE